MKKNNQNRQSTSLPVIEKSDDTRNYEFTGRLNYQAISQSTLNIIPDDCIKYFSINNTTVNLQNIPHGENCAYNPKGFHINLKKYLKPGTNTFHISILDFGGLSGITINNSYQDPLYATLLGSLLLEILILLGLFLKSHLRLKTSIIIIIILGIIIRIIYLSYTTDTERTHDVMNITGHMDYIKYIANHWNLPNPANTWEYHQPPLYYITAAIIYKISRAFSINYHSTLQILSLIFSAAFLVFGTLSLKILLKKESLLFASTALLAFWPSGIIHSIRLGNDPMYYMFYSATLFFMLKWITVKKSKFLYIAFLSTALIVLTKSSGIIFLGIIICTLLYVYLQDKNRKKLEYLKKTLIFISIIVLALYFSLYRNFKITLQDKNYNIINGSAAYSMGNGDIGNQLKNYFYFDGTTFLTKSFTNAWDDSEGRQYFWNYLLKTMLFGEFHFPLIIQDITAKAMSIILLAMTIFFLIGIAITLKKFNQHALITLLSLLLSLLSLLYFRHTYAFACNGDFRYIFPSIIQFIYFYITGINCFTRHKSKIISTIGYSLNYIFILASSIFFLSPLLLT